MHSVEEQPELTEPSVSELLVHDVARRQLDPASIAGKVCF